MQYLDPQPKESILDIGCGDGILTAEIATRSGSVVGVDFSDNMIRAAKENVASKHANAAFHVVDCRKLPPNVIPALTESGFDKVFSNAAMHWILSTEAIRQSFFNDVFRLVKPGGAFIFEMGGHGNVSAVHAVLFSTLHLKYNIPMSKLREVNPWFFPSVEWVQMALKQAGFIVDVAEIEYRPTKCTPKSADGSGGLEGWFKLMAAPFLELLNSQKDQDEAVELMCDFLKDMVTKVEDGSQWLGYMRLRAIARKPA